MRASTIVNIGPHAYQLRLVEGETTLEYSLYHANGYTQAAREGKPNTHGWKTSRRRWDNTPEGRINAILYAHHILRLTAHPRENDHE